MESKKKRPPLTFYIFVVLAFAGWAIFFMEALSLPRSSDLDLIIPGTLLLVVGFSILTISFWQTHLAVFAILLWVPFSAIGSVLQFITAIFAFRAEAFAFGLLSLALQCGAAYFLSRRGGLAWLTSGGYLGEEDWQDKEEWSEEEEEPA